MPHRARDVAESFGVDPDRYDRTRPRYPAAMVERIVGALPGHDVVDVGTGTGIAARQFAAAGCHVLGVEVDARMAEVARQAGIDVEVAAFEAWDPAGRTFDGVISGQTWHWVDPVAGAAKAAEALGPGGRLALFWNVGDPPADLATAFRAVYEHVETQLPFNPWARPALDAYGLIVGRAADAIRAAGPFEEPEEWRLTWTWPYSRDEWLDQVPTFGGHHRLPPATLEALVAGLGAAVDAAGGAFEMGYTTVVVTAGVNSIGSSTSVRAKKPGANRGS